MRALMGLVIGRVSYLHVLFGMTFLAVGIVSAKVVEMKITLRYPGRSAHECLVLLRLGSSCR